jgi:PBP1b-binding outer membrane lipoprotein LpoB
MKSSKSSLIILGSVGLMFLGACSNNNQAANTENSPAVSTSTSQTPSVLVSPTTKTDSEHGATHGGQVVETGSYHLELVPEKEANATHIDLYLQTGDNHETVPNAKVTAQVQLPDGKQKTISFNYDPKDKHYTGLLNEKASGQYQVKITADIKGQKTTGRFNFNR